VDSIPGLVARTAATGEIDAVNRQVLEYFGKTLEDLKHWATIGIVHPDDLDRTIASASHSFATGDPYDIEVRLRRHDGVFRWFQSRGLPVRDPEGQVAQWYFLYVDIDDRKRAEEALRASEFNARMIVDGIPGLVARVSPAGEVEVVNRPLLEYFGKTFEEVKHWANTDAVHPDDHAQSMEVFSKSLPAGDPFDVEERLRRFDGVYRWFQSRGLPLRDTDGRILNWYVLLTDIEERKQAEHKLRRSEAFLAEGQHLAKMGSFSWRVAKREITWSEQLYRIFEFEQGLPVTLEQIGSRVHPDDVPMLNDMIDKASQGVSDFEYEHRLLMPDRSVKYVHMIAHGVRDKDGLLEYVGAAQDITERRVSEHALGTLRSELAYVARISSLGALTASIAHEVNQPLTGVITNAGTCLRMLSNDPPDIEGALETARRTIRDGSRASEVIARLRTLYSKKEVSFDVMDLNEATLEVISLCISELHRNGVILRSVLAHTLPPVAGDRIQLQQVILNLLRNASDAMSTVEDRPRELVIRTERDQEDCVRLSVQDAGVGIDALGADRLFEAFYTTKSHGMGMGLSVSRSIIEAHRGRLWAMANDGPGTTFAFVLPCHHA
jgi:PAS domain S-box-containing protein